MIEEKINLCDLSAEIIGISRIVSGLSNQLDNKKTDTLTVDSLQKALFGVSTHLDRIVNDLQDADMRQWADSQNGTL